jgi:hypothetical protein
MAGAIITAAIGTGAAGIIAASITAIGATTELARLEEARLPNRQPRFLFVQNACICFAHVNPARLLLCLCEAHAIIQLQSHAFPERLGARGRFPSASSRRKS